LGHVDDAVGELWQLLREGGELIDQKQQRGRRLLGRLALQLDEILRHRREKALAPVQLGVQRHQRLMNEVPVQVCHESHDVRKVHAILEGCASLVVDKQERQAVRRDVGR